MKLHRIYHEGIQKFPEVIQEMILSELPHTRISDLPPAYQFLAGEFIDLGFEDFGLSPDDLDKLQRAFASNGVSVPGTTLKLRHERPGITIFEPISPDDAELLTLPLDWPAYAIVNGPGNQLNWIGEKARQERRPINIDLSLYTKHPMGWLLTQPPVEVTADLTPSGTTSTHP